jgi:hypothetical protein
LVWIGVYFALAQLGVDVPGIEQVWPILPVIGGLFFYLGFLVNPRAYGLVFPGTLFFLCGLFFLPFSLGLLEWESMERLWPVFPLIMGLAFVALWMANLGRVLGLLIPAGLFLSAGMVGLALTLTPLSGVVQTIGWPIALLAAGGAVLMFTVVGLGLRIARSLFGRAVT